VATRGQETKERIIRAAGHLFYNQGYKNTTMDDICRESGVRRGNLYFYFAGKEELAQAAIDDALKRQFEFIERAIAGETDPLAKIEASLDGMAAYLIARGCNGGCFFGNIALELGDVHRGLAEAADRFFSAWHQWLVALLEEAKADGTLKPDTDCLNLGRLIMSTMEGAILIAKASKDKHALAETVQALKSVIRGYAS